MKICIFTSRAFCRSQKSHYIVLHLSIFLWAAFVVILLKQFHYRLPYLLTHITLFILLFIAALMVTFFSQPFHGSEKLVILTLNEYITLLSVRHLRDMLIRRYCCRDRSKWANISRLVAILFTSLKYNSDVYFHFFYTVIQSKLLLCQCLVSTISSFLHTNIITNIRVNIQISKSRVRA